MFGTGQGGFGGFGGFGNPGMGGGFAPRPDLESQARQYWEAWANAMRGAPAAPASPVDEWNQAVQGWAQLFGAPSSPVGDMASRFGQQAADWYGRMQQVAAQFAGRAHTAADIAQAWREALGASATNPFAEIFSAMHGWGRHGLDGWAEQIAPFLHTLQQWQAQQQLHVPAFGPAREHQQRWQALAQAAQDYQQRNNEYNALLLKVAEKAYVAFEDKLEQRNATGQRIGSARALFDLWIDAAEEAYAREALSEEFRHAIGALANAQMRLRAAVQKEAEQFCNLFGLPTRTEVDSAHRKIAELQRELRKAARARTEAPRARPQPATAEPEPVAAGPNKPVAAKKPPAKPGARKTARPKKKPATSRAVAAKAEIVGKPATKKAAAKKPVPKKPSSPAAARTGAKVVSMKDWVARGMASIEAPKPAGPAARPKSGNGKGGRK